MVAYACTVRLKYGLFFNLSLFPFVDHEKLGLGLNSIAAAHRIMSPYSIQPINCIAHRHHIVSPIVEVDYYFAWNKGKHLRTSEAVN